MRRVLLTEKAANEVMRIREDKFGTFSDEKGFIADAFGVLNDLVNIARDSSDVIGACVDDLLKVMDVLNRYNSLLNVLNNSSDHEFGKFEYVESNKEYDNDNNSAMSCLEVELLKQVIAKIPKLEKIFVPVEVDAITMSEAADVIGLSVEELHRMINEERKKL